MLYEASGVFSTLYRNLGYHVVQVDQQLDGTDVRLLPKQYADVVGILAFPPCTHLAGSGARWWKQKGDAALLEALSCVDAVFRLVQIYRPHFWLIENPVGRLTRFIGKPAHMFHPHEYAGYLENPSVEAYSKKTCLWGHFRMPEKKPVPPLHGSMMAKLRDPETGKFYSFTSRECKNWRSRTPLGFARAFVEVNS
ncbi:hypothetical protein [Cerasicoccus maritimus]|uniref:hypothetical protein n=1 Tax=Cerasicoccus maritimus TaxID=490089 RepID=UPI0028525F17|nr:hypothetical protein [Cerasicoccus maritimus]